MPGHGIDDQNPLARLEGGVQVGERVHEVVIDLESACGIDDDEIAKIFSEMGFEALPGAMGSFVILDFQDRNVDLVAQHAELFPCCWALSVGSDQQGPTSLCFVFVGQLSGSRGLAGTLKAHQEPDIAVVFKAGLLGLTAERFDEFVVHNRDDALFGP